MPIYAKGMKFNSQMIQALDKCRLIALGTVGVDYVDVAAATEKGIPVTNCPDTFIEEVADHAMMLLLATHRRAIEQDRMVREGRWTEGRPQLLKVPRLMGQTLGFIAFGRVARAVAERARAFGLRMLAYDPFLDELNISALGVEPASLAELLSRSDFISMHLPATPEAVGFLKEQHFRQMKPNAIFINTGRGPTVHEPALIKALQEKWIAGAGLDVLQIEPVKPDNPLLKMPHVDPLAAQRLGVGPLRSRAQAPRRAGAGPGAGGPLADVVRQSDGVAGERPAPLAADLHAARPECLMDALSKAKAPLPLRGGRKTRHELAPPTCANRSAHEACGANSFGASGGGVCRALTPTRNAIGLKTADGVWSLLSRTAVSSPWRSVLPPPGGGARERSWDCQSAPQVAGDPMPGGALLELGRHLAAQRQLADRAAGVEMAARRRPDRVRHVALQHDALALGLGIGDGHGREQRLGVGMQRRGVEVLAPRRSRRCGPDTSRPRGWRCARPPTGRGR